MLFGSTCIVELLSYLTQVTCHLYTVLDYKCWSPVRKRFPLRVQMILPIMYVTINDINNKNQQDGL